MKKYSKVLGVLVAISMQSMSFSAEAEAIKDSLVIRYTLKNSKVSDLSIGYQLETKDNYDLYAGFLTSNNREGFILERSDSIESLVLDSLALKDRIRVGTSTVDFGSFDEIINIKAIVDRGAGSNVLLGMKNLNVYPTKVNVDPLGQDAGLFSPSPLRSLPIYIYNEGAFDSENISDGVALSVEIADNKTINDLWLEYKPKKDDEWWLEQMDRGSSLLLKQAVRIQASALPSGTHKYKLKSSNKNNIPLIFEIDVVKTDPNPKDNRKQTVTGLSSSEKLPVIYPINSDNDFRWEGRNLMWKSASGEYIIIDNRGSREYRGPSKNLIITSPLSFKTTTYPDCIGATPGTHPLSCRSSIILTKDTVISERWSRSENVMKDGMIADVTLSMGLISHKFLGKGFDMSVSKLPGDFSEENSCRPNKVGARSTSVNLTQVGGKHADGKEGGVFDFHKACWLDATKWKHYYINVRSLEKSSDKKCGTGKNKCQFEIVAPK